MSDQPSKATSPIVCYGLAVYLIGSLLWRVLIPAHEYAGTSTVYLGIAVDVLAVELKVSRCVAADDDGIVVPVAGYRQHIVTAIVMRLNRHVAILSKELQIRSASALSGHRFKRRDTGEG